ncbi:hypothetical protein VFPPC_18100 [Pochonia chlamydosporia 170]|uniref:Uncharacterized protein n=1 Tax=Pochonia chlamydosporia 170 TaxID=1380566 RepID=A0A219APD6_METCM|nr:hypothetical protein VFPPC_18100 [Pochonia chlamydosporia 170]OWT42687.1 hypothetical protein VFPPC_18100 [Pochonia chlamydosporia 170]
MQSSNLLLLILSVGAIASPVAAPNEDSTLEARGGPYPCSYWSDNCKKDCTGGSMYLNCAASYCAGTVCKCNCHYG